MALPNKTLRMMLTQGEMEIEPFTPEKTRVNEVGNSAISYGQGPYGYDLRLASDGVWWMPPDPEREIDPKRFDRSLLVRLEPQRDENGDEYVVMPPGGFVLAYSLERMVMPDCLALCVGKSTYARVGILPLLTPLEPRWRGHVTLEIVNLTGCKVRLYLREGICQVIFLNSDQSSGTPYSGPYQDQPAEVVPPRVGGGA